MLTEAAIRAAKPREKAYKLTDGNGLHLHVDPRGGRWWRFRYRYQGREKMISLGTYPDTPLKLARERTTDARKLLAKKTDPAAERRAEKAAQQDTLAALAEEYFKLQSAKLSSITLRAARDRFAKWILPGLGKRSISSITAKDLLASLRRVEERGKVETTHRVKGIFSRIVRYAIATGRAERDVSADLRGALAPKVTENHAGITEPAKVGALLRAIDGFQGQPATMAALKLAPLLFVRPGELRAARWSEFDLDGEEPTWRIAAERMKMREEHIVPLPSQAVAILQDLRALTGAGGLCFPGLRSRSRPISENTLNAALRRLGFNGDEQTGHGFRSMASTLLNEQGFAPDVIELQLAHAERNKVRAAYNKAKRLAERRVMMQAWADYLEGLKVSANVVALKRRGSAA
jgi:integrase